MENSLDFWYLWYFRNTTLILFSGGMGIMITLSPRVPVRQVSVPPFPVSRRAGGNIDHLPPALLNPDRNKRGLKVRGWQPDAKYPKDRDLMKPLTYIHGETGKTAFLFTTPLLKVPSQSPRQIMGMSALQGKYTYLQTGFYADIPFSMREPYHSMNFHSLSAYKSSSKVHGSLSWGCVA